MPLGSELRQELGLSPFPLIDERLDTIDCLLAASYSSSIPPCSGECLCFWDTTRHALNRDDLPPSLMNTMTILVISAVVLTTATNELMIVDPVWVHIWMAGATIFLLIVR